MNQSTHTEQVSVQAAAGSIQGRVKNGALLFAGIPYAKAPVESLRFRPPQPLAGFAEPYPALKFSPAAPQIPSGGMTDNVPVRWSEDCLYLNVFSPRAPSPDKQGYPVILWVHGGG